MPDNGIKDLSGNGSNILMKSKNARLVHTFTAAGASPWVRLSGEQSVYITGGVGTVEIERSPDNGVTAVDVVLPDGSTNAEYTDNGTFNVDFGKSSLIRFNCTAYTSGSIRVQVGDAA